jgi:hypothetical protein
VLYRNSVSLANLATSPTILDTYRGRQFFSETGEERQKPVRRSTPFSKYNESTITTLPGSQPKEEPKRVVSYIKPDFHSHIETLPGKLINPEPQVVPKRESTEYKSQRFLLTSTEREMMYGPDKTAKAPLKLITPRNYDLVRSNFAGIGIESHTKSCKAIKARPHLFNSNSTKEEAFVPSRKARPTSCRNLHASTLQLG